MRNYRSYKKVGDFHLSQPTIEVSDPGYPRGEWCAKEVKNCLPGKWTASININNYTWKQEDGTVSKDHRVAALFARHESLPSNAVFNRIHWYEEKKGILYRDGWKRLSENIGVDSGQCGFFDFEKFGDNSLFDQPGKCGFGDEWYSNCCDLTLGDYAGIVADMGVNASSGFGDGCYCVWGHENKDGKVDALVLFFLPDDEEEDTE